MTIPPRRVSAVVEPPDAPAVIVKRLASWKVLGALTGTVLAGAVAFGVWKSSIATRADLAAATAAEAGERSADLLATQALRDRVLRVEVDMAWIRAQLTEVAHATGARVVPPPQAQP